MNVIILHVTRLLSVEYTQVHDFGQGLCGLDALYAISVLVQGRRNNANAHESRHNDK